MAPVAIHSAAERTCLQPVHLGGAAVRLTAERTVFSGEFSTAETVFGVTTTSPLGATEGTAALLTPGEHITSAFWSGCALREAFEAVAVTGLAPTPDPDDDGTAEGAAATPSAEW